MIDEKILRYRKDLSLARNKAKNFYADTDYYEKMALKLEKILKFYQKLKGNE